jgi:cyanophycinase
LIRPLYLLADSQLLFQQGSDSLAGRVRADLPEDNAKAAYIGASSGDQPEFYDLFTSAIELMEITRCRMVPARPSPEDRAFLEEAGLLLLGGGDVERGWRVFEQNGLKDLVARKRYDGAILIGVSAGAVQLGLGALSNAPQPQKIELFRFAPFYVGAHDEKNEWWDHRDSHRWRRCLLAGWNPGTVAPSLDRAGERRPSDQGTIALPVSPHPVNCRPIPEWYTQWR